VVEEMRSSSGRGAPRGGSSLPWRQLQWERDVVLRLVVVYIVVSSLVVVIVLVRDGILESEVAAAVEGCG
jgi:hypothetical protein